jgi:hypothetical protein
LDVVKRLLSADLGSRTVQNGSQRGQWYDRRRVVLLSFLFAVVASFGGLGYAIASGLSLWRQVKRTGRTLSAELATFDERAARTERVLAEAERSSVALAEAQARLRVSRAHLRVLTDEIERARRRTRWITAFLPTR